MQTDGELKSLPTNVDAERFVLGSILLDDSNFTQTTGILSQDDFSLEKNRRIFRRMGEIQGRGEKIDRITVANELMKFGELESCDGLTYIVSLDDGLPQIPNIDSYVRIVKEKAALRRIILASQYAMNRCLSGQEGPEEILSGLAKSITELGGAQDAAKSSYDLTGFLESIGGVSEFFKENRGIQSPWHGFNDATGGWNSGELSIIAARPSMGKTAFALNAFYDAGRRGVPAVFYTCEMSALAIWKRLVSLLTGISFIEIQKSELNASERRSCSEALASLTELPLSVISASGKTAGWIRGSVERLKRQGMCAFAILDYIGLVRGSGDGTNRNRELGEIARSFKLTAGELAIPFLVLAQLNRGVESRTDKRPMPSDLRDSGEIEEHADLLGFLYRPEYYDRDNQAVKGLAELIISKQRNGPTPTIQLDFDYRAGKFSDIDPRDA